MMAYICMCVSLSLYNFLTTHAGMLTSLSLSDLNKTSSRISTRVIRTPDLIIWIYVLCLNM